MTPERWKQIEQLYHSSLKQEPNQRVAFLTEACAGDEELRHEVESLLAFEPRAESFIESPPAEALEDAARGLAAEPASPRLTGDIGHYQILSRLGEGGMGVVYKARDKSLGRLVAIKVLPAGLVADPEHRRRLVLEARMASALNHPNIVTVHEISNQNGIDFIVMEYVAGKTLDQLIPGGGLPLNGTLGFAVQIADALAAAHEAGIIHRDLKPGNVMVSDKGLVKVLDFGLAKLTTASANQGPGFITTLASGCGPRTGEGTLLGTVSYMSPEQAEGKRLDARSDIFSFGLVLYEMVTGLRAFAGDSHLAILTAILREEPKPVSQIVKGAPDELEKTIQRCLRKDRERRWQTMGDVKIALQEAKEELDGAKQVSAPVLRPGRRWGLIWTTLALTLLVAGVVGIWLHRSATEVAEAPMSVVPLTSYPGEERQPSFSPDGNQVTFSWNGEKEDNFDIYIKDIGTGAQLRLTRAPEADVSPSWSPDGRSIAFVRQEPGEKASVYLISPLGPPERKVTEIQYWHWLGGLLAWTPDGKSLVVSDRESKNGSLSLFLLSVATGEKRRLTNPADKSSDFYPAVSPDGRTLAFIRELNIFFSEIYTVALSEDFQSVGEPKRLTFENRMILSPAWTLDGQEIIFSSGSYRASNLFRIAASGSGTPQRLAAAGEDGSDPAVSHRMQRLAYTRELNDMNIWRLEVRGPLGTTNPVKLVPSTRDDGEASFSPDGKKIAFGSARAGSFEVWVCEADGSKAQQLTSFGTRCGAPRWSPDGQSIAFDASMNGQWDIYLINGNGGKPERFTDSPANEGIPSWSHDGKWIYFRSDRSGEDQIWKAPREGGEAVQVTSKGGVEAFESADGDWIYYTKGDGNNSSLWRKPRDGAEETEVLESVAQRAFAVVKEGIWFIPKPDSDNRTSIRFLNFKTHKIRSVMPIDKPLGGYLSLSPDGRWILYSLVDQTGSDLMMVENFR